MSGKPRGKTGPKSQWTEKEFHILRTLWPTALTLKEMTVLLRKSKSNISEMASKLGLPSRIGSVMIIRGEVGEITARCVKRRCPDCLGHFKTTPGGYDHEGCPALGRGAA